MNADPTTLEVMNRLYKEKKEKLKSGKANTILEKYGGQEHMEAPPPELLFAQSEAYVEYDRSGSVKRGQEKAAARSKYEEDLYQYNHTSAWGSYFDRTNMRWGYADDLSTVRHSYGTGEAGKRARELAAARIAMASTEQTEAAGVTGPSALAGLGTSAAAPPRAMYGLGEELHEATLDEAKVKASMAEQRRRATEAETNDRKRRYNSNISDEVTAEEMEAYHRIKKRDTTGDMADPMANFRDSIGAHFPS